MLCILLIMISQSTSSTFVPNSKNRYYGRLTSKQFVKSRAGHRWWAHMFDGMNEKHVDFATGIFTIVTRLQKSPMPVRCSQITCLSCSANRFQLSKGGIAWSRNSATALSCSSIHHFVPRSALPRSRSRKLLLNPSRYSIPGSVL